MSIASQFDLVFEATNRSGGAQAALNLARPGGTVIPEGINEGSVPSLVSDSFSLKQLRVLGVFGASSRSWRWVIDMFLSKRLRFELLVTHSFALEDYAAAVGAVRDRSAGAVKVQMQP